VVGIEHLPLARLRSEFVQLADLPLEAFAFALQRVLGAAGIQDGLVGCAPFLPATAQ
jgi:hypothetical protein